MRGAANKLCSIFLRSVWQMPQASTRISSSLRPISGVAMDSTSMELLPLYTAARIAGGALYNTGRSQLVTLESAVGKKLSQRLSGELTAFVETQQFRKPQKWPA